MSASGQSSDNGTTADWPAKYRARYWSRALLPYQVSAVLFAVGMLKRPTRILSAVGTLVAAAAGGALIGLLAGLTAYWPIFAVTPPLIVLAGTLTAIVSHPRRTKMFDRYRPGTESRIMVADGSLILSLNSHLQRLPIDGILKIWHFGELSAIEFSDSAQFSGTRSVVIPTAFVPHRSAVNTPEINSRWGKPRKPFGQAQ